LEHERKHEWLDANWWNQTKSDIDGLEGRYCSRRCARLAAEIGTLIIGMNYANLRGQNALLDLQANATALREQFQYELKQQEYNTAQAAWRAYSGFYDAKVREWDRARCCKSRS